jgi:hypothetical protein
MSAAINWFEIPVTEMSRAVKFYEDVLGTSLKRENFLGVSHAIFSVGERGETTGALIHDDKRPPVAGGSVVYLSVNHRLDECLSRVHAAGGKVLVPRTDIGPAGVFAVLQDTEGNTVGLHTVA